MDSPGKGPYRPDAVEVCPMGQRPSFFLLHSLSPLSETGGCGLEESWGRPTLPPCGGGRLRTQRPC